MKKPSGLDIMNQAAQVVQNKMSGKAPKKAKKPAPVEGSDEEEAEETPAEATVEGDAGAVSLKKKKSQKEMAAIKEKMKQKGA